MVKTWSDLALVGFVGRQSPLLFIPCQETAIFGSAHEQTEESTDRRFGQNVAVLEALADNKSRQLRLIPIVALAGAVSIGQTRGVAEIAY